MYRLVDLFSVLSNKPFVIAKELNYQTNINLSLQIMVVLMTCFFRFCQTIMQFLAIIMQSKYSFWTSLAPYQEGCHCLLKWNVSF